LSLKLDEEVEIKYRQCPGWLMIENSCGQIGLVPEKCVKATKTIESMADLE
jgi:hypothetical protein